MEKEIYEVTDPLRLLDTEKGVWRAALRKGTGKYLGSDLGYEKGDVVTFSTKTYCDAERAGFSGYLGHSVELPLSVLLTVADAVRAGEVPERDD